MKLKPVGQKPAAKMRHDRGRGSLGIHQPLKVVWHRPVLYKKQRDAIYASERYSLIEATTKSGKTVGCMVWLFEQALSGRPGDQYWWVAPTLKQAKIAFRRYCFGIRRAMRDSKNIDGPLFLANRSDLTITLFNGCVLAFLSGENPDNLYGEDVRAAVMDEASRAREEAFHAVRSTLTATVGPVRIIGNVKGRKNWFYRMCRKAESQADLPAEKRTMHYSKITADDAVRAGVLDSEEIDDARDALPEAVFLQLYYAEPTDDEGNPFGLKSIRECIVDAISKNRVVMWGIDLAKKQDFTVIIGLDESGAVAHFERFQKSWEDTIAHIKRVCRGARAYVDSTGVGDPVLEALQKNGGGRFIGYPFTAKSKQQLMEGLAVSIQSGRLKYPAGPIVQELEIFEYEFTRTGVKYSAPAGMHDDCVIALALANHGMRWKKRTIRAEDVEIVQSVIYSESSAYPQASDDDF